MVKDQAMMEEIRDLMILRVERAGVKTNHTMVVKMATPKIIIAKKEEKQVTGTEETLMKSRMMAISKVATKEVLMAASKSSPCLWFEIL